jgi:citrate lyase beta subunit
MTTTDRYRRIRSVLESPVLDERKFGKLPGVPCDAALIDMEDSVPLGRKDEGRAAVLAALRDRAFFGERVVIARPNPLHTPWGHEDVVGLAGVGVECMMVPKVRSVGEVLEVQRLLREHGADPDLVLCIETPHAVACVEDLCALPKVVAVVFGEGDLSADLGVAINLPDGRVNPVLLPARSRTCVAAAAADIPMFDFAVLREIRDLDEYRTRAGELIAMGASAICTIYPPHVEIANELLTPTPEAVADARHVIDRFDAARAAGAPAVRLEDGRTLLIHDFTKAQRTLLRAGEAA